MPLATETVSCDITAFDGVDFDAGLVRLTFQLNATDWDEVTNEIVPNDLRRFDVDSSGQVDVELWPNDRGAKGTSYTVAAEVIATESGKSGVTVYTFGSIQPEDGAGPYDLADLLSAGADPLEQVVLSYFTLSEYASAIASDGVLPLEFSSRSALVAAIAGGLTPLNGVTYRANGIAFLGQTGATDIADMPGLVPAGDIYPDHFGGNTSLAINRAIDFASANGGGAVRLKSETVYDCETTIVMKDYVSLISEGSGAIIRLADGANTRLLESENFDAQKAGTDTGVSIGLAFANLIFVGNKDNNPNGEGVFLSESGMKWENIVIDHFAGTGFERQGTRSVDFADDGSGNFPISPFVRRVETIMNDIYVWRCGNATDPAVLLEGAGDLHGGYWFFGGNDGQVILNSVSGDVEYLHSYDNGAAVADDYSTLVQTQMVFGTLEVRDNDYGGVKFTADETMVGNLYASKNGRKATAAGVYQVDIEANRCSIANGLIAAKDQPGLAFDGDGQMPLLRISGNQNEVSSRLTGNIEAVRSATEGLNISGSENIIRMSVYGIDGPAVIYNSGSYNDINFSAADCDTALQKDAYNTGGSWDIRANSGSVDAAISGTTQTPGTVEDMTFMYGGDDLCSFRALSEDVAADATGNGQLTIAHGLLAQPSYSDITCSLTRGTGAYPGDAEIEVAVESRDATNVYIRWRVRTASATSGAKFKVAVHGKLGV